MFNEEVDVGCAYDGKDVAKNFKVIIIIYFTIGIVDCVRCFTFLLAIFTKKKALAHIHGLLQPVECLGFAALIILHVYRFRKAGKFCAGDEGDYGFGFAFGALAKRGEYLLGLVIAIWVLVGVSCLLVCCLPLILLKIAT